MTVATPPPATAPTRPFWLRRPERQQDAATALSILATLVELVRLLAEAAPVVVWIGAIATLVGALLARRTPWPGLLLALAGTAVVLVGGDAPIVEYSVVVFTLFGLTLRGFAPLRGTVVTAGALAVLFGTAALVQHVDPLQTNAIAAVVAAIAGGAVGTALRVQRQYWETLELREQDAIARGEVEAERRAAEERLRIARDLHDIIGHNVAVISMHLGAVEASAGRDPAVLDRSLRASRDAVQAVLAETQQTLHLLRGPDEPDRAGSGPTPGLADVPELLASFEQIGLHVDAALALDPRVAVDQGVGLIAYRLIQEALTNAHRYGDGEVAIELAEAADGVSIVITNPIVSGRTTPGTGYGLLGMGERVASVGGTVEIGEDDGVFRVAARLPMSGRVGA